MIRKIEIQNYRSCLDTSFELHPNLSVLIGPNSSGKTNILNAMLLLRKLAEEYQYRSLPEEQTRQCGLKVWFDIDDYRMTLSALVDIFTDDNNRDVVYSSSQQWYAKDLTGNRKRIRLPLWLARELFIPESDERFLRLSRFRRYPVDIERALRSIPPSVGKSIAQIAGAISEMSYYGASQFTNPANCPVSFEIETEGKSSRGVGLRGHTKLLADMYNSFKAKDNASYAQFFEIIGPKGLDLVDNIDFEEMRTSSIEYSVRSGGGVVQRKREKSLVIPRFRIGKNDLSPNQLSEGTFKTITLLFYLITEKSKVLLIEEPEVCVHHGLLSSIIELIRTYSKDKQIVVTTHSDFVLDEVQPENVYKVTNVVEEGTKVSHLTKSMSRKERAALHEYLKKEGNLGEYWRYGGIE